jgi:hypothetical protein
VEIAQSEYYMSIINGWKKREFIPADGLLTLF